jgi:hypothetical protein
VPLELTPTAARQNFFAAPDNFGFGK